VWGARAAHVALLLCCAVVVAKLLAGGGPACGPGGGSCLRLSGCRAASNASEEAAGAGSANPSKRSPSPRILLFLTTHFSAEHVAFLQRCWPPAIARSRLLQSVAHVLVFSTGCGYTEQLALLRATFPNTTSLEMHEYNNPGYQHGAVMALDVALQEGWFNGFDWVVRLNPDVIIRNDTWLLDTMGDAGVDGIFADCNDTPCPARVKCEAAHINTDFFAVRPAAVTPLPIDNAVQPHAETRATAVFRPIVLAGRDRWLETEQQGYCRVRGPRATVLHEHAFLHSCVNDLAPP
jgi:hypothetical protein